MWVRVPPSAHIKRRIMKYIIFLILINILFPSVSVYIEDINKSINNMEIDKAKQIFNKGIK